MRTKCLITGCALRLAGSRHVIVGDLYLQGRDTFIFNGNYERTEYGVCAKWIPEEDNHYGRLLLIPPTYEYFERRGMFVLRAARHLLNAEARAYLGEELEEVPA